MSEETVVVTLPSDLAEMLRREVASGVRGSSSEVVADALALWRERTDRLSAIRASLDEAARDPDRIDADAMRRRLSELEGRRRATAT